MSGFSKGDERVFDGRAKALKKRESPSQYRRPRVLSESQSASK